MQKKNVLYSNPLLESACIIKVVEGMTLWNVCEGG